MKKTAILFMVCMVLMLSFSSFAAAAHQEKITGDDPYFSVTVPEAFSVDLLKGAKPLNHLYMRTTATSDSKSCLMTFGASARPNLAYDLTSENINEKDVIPPIFKEDSQVVDKGILTTVDGEKVVWFQLANTGKYDGLKSTIMMFELLKHAHIYSLTFVFPENQNADFIPAAKTAAESIRIEK